MTCQHCVSSVTEEVCAVSGVTDVRVDLDSGQLIVISDDRNPVREHRSGGRRGRLRVVAA